MTVEHLEVLVEEPSMEAALEALLPRILGDVSFKIMRFQCKDDLLSKLEARLRGYASWLPSSWRILVLVDRDDDDCAELKAKMDSFCARAGLTSRSADRAGYQVVNRIAIEELESWFFGDWTAVTTAYPGVSATVPQQASFRDPDAISGGTWEALERVFKKGRHFQAGLRKIEAARTIAAHMDPSRNRSRSFQVLRAALEEMTGSGPDRKGCEKGAG